MFEIGLGIGKSYVLSIQTKNQMNNNSIIMYDNDIFSNYSSTHVQLPLVRLAAAAEQTSL